MKMPSMLCGTVACGFWCGQTGEKPRPTSGLDRLSSLLPFSWTGCTRAGQHPSVKLERDGISARWEVRRVAVDMASSENIDHPEGTARQPFHFNTSSHLLRIGQERAANLTELLQALRTCSENSIFQHTFRTLHEHHFIREGFSNDFAHWTLPACNEPGLAERLASVDVREFTSAQAVREQIIEIVEAYIQQKPDINQRYVHEPFYFCAADVVVLPTAFVAHNLTEFVDGLLHVSVHSIHHHFIEARLRLKLTSNDFSLWLQEEAGVPETARRVNRIDIYTATMEDVRRQIIRIVDACV